MLSISNEIDPLIFRCAHAFFHQVWVQGSSQTNDECERPQTWGALKKEIWILFKAPLFLGKWCGVTTYLFYTKNKKN